MSTYLVAYMVADYEYIYSTTDNDYGGETYVCGAPVISYKLLTTTHTLGNSHNECNFNIVKFNVICSYAFISRYLD